MTMDTVSSDGQVRFLPHRLNRQPVVVRGLTANELWVCATLFALLGLALGIALATLAGSFAVIPTSIGLCAAIGIFAGGGFLRAKKRGRPETWLYRHLQWWVARHLPFMASFTGGTELILRSTGWGVKRTRHPL